MEEQILNDWTEMDSKLGCARVVLSRVTAPNFTVEMQNAKTSGKYSSKYLMPEIKDVENVVHDFEEPLVEILLSELEKRIKLNDRQQEHFLDNEHSVTGSASDQRSDCGEVLGNAEENLANAFQQLDLPDFVLSVIQTDHDSSNEQTEPTFEKNSASNPQTTECCNIESSHIDSFVLKEQPPLGQQKPICDTSILENLVEENSSVQYPDLPHFKRVDLMDMTATTDELEVPLVVPEKEITEKMASPLNHLNFEECIPKKAVTCLRDPVSLAQESKTLCEAQSMCHEQSNPNVDLKTTNRQASFVEDHSTIEKSVSCNREKEPLNIKNKEQNKKYRRNLVFENSVNKADTRRKRRPSKKRKMCVETAVQTLPFGGETANMPYGFEEQNAFSFGGIHAPHNTDWHYGYSSSYMEYDGNRSENVNSNSRCSMACADQQSTFQHICSRNTAHRFYFNQCCCDRSSSERHRTFASFSNQDHSRSELMHESDITRCPSRKSTDILGMTCPNCRFQTTWKLVAVPNEHPMMDRYGQIYHTASQAAAETFHGIHNAHQCNNVNANRDGWVSSCCNNLHNGTFCPAMSNDSFSVQNTADCRTSQLNAVPEKTSHQSYMPSCSADHDTHSMEAGNLHNQQTLVVNHSYVLGCTNGGNGTCTEVWSDAALGSGANGSQNSTVPDSPADAMPNPNAVLASDANEPQNWSYMQQLTDTIGCASVAHSMNVESTAECLGQTDLDMDPLEDCLIAVPIANVFCSLSLDKTNSVRD